eukprot:CAMPEP_0174866228 /NCGR_PEP_ID=MMETSP1114-20130205/61727_1 /TAXON_ID=312471 /ORGANISM="Neobodo designis, Strain CCAP 1951/1" /LENGTH=114 /DNA_ID=CAMNT_0016101377 /DNA_START=40 /DNA_END=380 /DNA_ORIENTATION=+
MERLVGARPRGFCGPLASDDRRLSPPPPPALMMATVLRRERKLKASFTSPSSSAGVALLRDSVRLAFNVPPSGIPPATVDRRRVPSNRIDASGTAEWRRLRPNGGVVTEPTEAT